MGVIPYAALRLGIYDFLKFSYKKASALVSCWVGWVVGWVGRANNLSELEDGTAGCVLIGSGGLGLCSACPALLSPHLHSLSISLTLNTPNMFVFEPSRLRLMSHIVSEHA